MEGDHSDGFQGEWTINVVIPLFKSGDINNPSKNCIIMVNPLMGNIFGSMIEQRIGIWEESKGKRAKYKQDLDLDTLPFVSPLDI